MNDLRYDERTIINHIITTAMARGLLLSIYDGEEWALKLSKDEAAIRQAIATTDETFLRFRDPAHADGRGNPKVIGTVQLVHGLGCDVIADHTDTPETVALLSGALALAERFAQ